MVKLHNTKSKLLEEFKPIVPNEVSMYTCGPTVYNYPHIGNYRSYIFSDLLKRVLFLNGFSVNHVMNITDVDDKTIRDSQKEGKSLRDFTEFYTAEFMKDLDALNIIPANTFPKATDHIPEMTSMIGTLIDTNHAYKAPDGSVYFDISSFSKYGELSGVDFGGVKQTERAKKDEYSKEDAQDFALWKAYESEDGDVAWDTTLGKGRPGWHIECSAMSTKYLGNHFDIHTGGVDLVFPHHENEIAQSVCAHGGEFVNYWLHNEHLMVDGKKMSKSAGNFYTLQDIKDRGFLPLSFRYFLLQAHYRTQTNFTWEAMEASQNALRKLHLSTRNLKPGFFGKLFAKIDIDYLKTFSEAINDDLDTPRALATMWEMMKSKISDASKLKTLIEMDRFLGLDVQTEFEIAQIPNEVVRLADKRESARREKNYKEADRLREEIRLTGYQVLDTDSGPRIEKI